MSDPVFEPSALRRGWQAFWCSTARLGFASAAMLSIALVVFALAPRNVPKAPAPAPALDRAGLEADFTRRLSDAVQNAVAQSEARTQALLAASEKHHAEEMQDIEKQVSEYLDVERKRRDAYILASNRVAEAGDAR